MVKDVLRTYTLFTPASSGHRNSSSSSSFGMIYTWPILGYHISLWPIMLGKNLFVYWLIEVVSFEGHHQCCTRIQVNTTMVSKNLPITNLRYQSNIDTWWICQGEGFLYIKVSVWVNPLLIVSVLQCFHLGMKVFASYTYLNGIKTQTLSNIHTLIVLKKGYIISTLNHN